MKFSAKCFFRKAIRENGKPEKITIDKSGSNKSAVNTINDEFEKDEKIEIRQIKYLNNIVEQDRRFIKQRTRPTLGFKSFWSAKKTIAGFEILHMIKKGQLDTQGATNSNFENFASLVA